MVPTGPPDGVVGLIVEAISPVDAASRGVSIAEMRKLKRLRPRVSTAQAAPAGQGGESVSAENAIVPAVPPSGPGCVECEATGGWWFHLRRCATCGRVGCCDSSPSQHASHHAADSGHAVVCSYEPDEDWFWDYFAEDYLDGPAMAPPHHHPLDQPVPGPAGRVPRDWESRLH